MAKIHDLFIIELAEVIKGYGNDPDVEDPFRLSEFYRFYELPNIAVSRENFEKMRPAQPDQSKYEYHYDHTDCIWYRPEARNRCPVTCAQYRDGWNDAMEYIFRDGKGYRPYRRGERYEE